MSYDGIFAAAAALLFVLGCSQRKDPSGESVTAGVAPASAAQPQVDWSAVETAIGRPGASQSGDVYRFSFPRSDMQVTAAGVKLRPALALGGWVAMKSAPGGVVAMGDLVLTESEVGAVVSRLQEGGVEQTAVHHHVLHETPRVVYMHIHGHGDPVKLGETIRAAVALTGAPAPQPTTPPSADPLGIDTAQIAQVLGHAGRVTGGVYQVSVPRAETIRDGDFEIPPSMGLATALNFQPTGGGKAAITGDFVMVASEVNAVIRALRENGIEVTSLHNHLLTEMPRLFFMHFWANDDAVTLARGLRAGLDKTNSRQQAR
jgi:hypothetical protein